MCDGAAITDPARVCLRMNPSRRQWLGGIVAGAAASWQDWGSAASAAESVAEGLFFPNTYLFAKQSSDLDVLRRSYQTMARVIEAEMPGWSIDFTHRISSGFYKSQAMGISRA